MLPTRAFLGKIFPRNFWCYQSWKSNASAINGGIRGKKVGRCPVWPRDGSWSLRSPLQTFFFPVAPMENRVICQPSPHLGICTCTVLALNTLRVHSELQNIWLPLSFPCSSEPSSISQYQINGFKQRNPCWYENSSASGLTPLLGSSLLRHLIQQRPGARCSASLVPRSLLSAISSGAGL